MAIHILTPFSRAHNLEAMRSMLLAAHKGCRSPLWWYPVYDSRVACSLLANDWTRPIYAEHGPHCDIANARDACYWKLNVALDAVTANAQDSDYIGCICDDDAYDTGLLSTIENQTAPMVVVSLVVHYHMATEHSIMLADQNGSRVGTVGFASYFVRADCLRRERFQNLWCADGALFETLKYRHGSAVVYLPSLRSHWNILPA